MSRISLLIFCVFLYPGLAVSASFDCKKASTKIEKLICSDESLGFLDEELSKAYKNLKESKGNSGVEALRKSQKAWLRLRNFKCSDKITCRTVYVDRVIELMNDLPRGENITTLDIYAKFNMRSVYSSYGQRVKFYCESYPSEYFSVIESISADKLELSDEDDYWYFTIEGKNNIYLFNQITSGTYKSESEYEVVYDAKHDDWRADETFIKIDGDCKPFKK